MSQPQSNIAVAIAVGSTLLASLAIVYKSIPREIPPTVETSPGHRSPVDTSLNYSFRVTPDAADAQRRMYGGEFVKHLDVAAGIVAARHSGGRPCATRSADRIVWLSELSTGDVVHVSAQVNRAWNTSMEIGVRAEKEDAHGVKSHCCHAYFTFVVVTTGEPTRLPAIEPSTSLEKKRYLLAGRRRQRRLAESAESATLATAFRDQITTTLAQIEELQRLVELEGRSESLESQEALLESLQRELLADAYSKGDEDVTLIDGILSVEIEGETVSMPLHEVAKVTTKGWRTLHSTLAREPFRATGPEMTDNITKLSMADTIVKNVWVVRPQFCNSRGVLFGGQLVRWIESAAAMSAMKLSRTAAFASAAIDALSFRSPVLPGEVVHLIAVVLRTWNSSLEVRVCVWAEPRIGDTADETLPRRLISESFFTLVAIDSESGRPMRGCLAPIICTSAAATLAAGADARRQDRLREKRMLQRVYN